MYPMVQIVRQFSLQFKPKASDRWLVDLSITALHSGFTRWPNVCEMLTKRKQCVEWNI